MSFKFFFDINSKHNNCFEWRFFKGNTVKFFSNSRFIWSVMVSQWCGCEKKLGVFWFKGSYCAGLCILGFVYNFYSFLCISSCEVVIDDCFNQQANTTDELPERLIGAVRVSHIELKSAIVPKLDLEASWLTEVFRYACILFHFPLDCHFTWYRKAHVTIVFQLDFCIK
jgi:hypothetical protein